MLGSLILNGKPNTYPHKATNTKGQLISKNPFGVIVSTKIATKFKRISALASTKSILFIFNY